MITNPEIVPADSRYVPITQQPYCCVPACIQMIMNKHGIPLVPQDLLGCELGLVVPENDRKLYWNARTGEMPISGYGTQVSKNPPNEVFVRLGIPLSYTYHSIDIFNESSTTEFIAQAVQQDRDVLACFDYGILYGTDYHYGHLSVVDQIDVAQQNVRLIDPEYNTPKWRIVPLSKLFQAMKAHGPAKTAGFWEFTAAS